MNRLQTRLLLSYLLLLTVTIGAAMLSLLFILNTRAAPPQPTWQRLAAVASTVDIRQVLISAFLNNGPGSLQPVEQSLEALTLELDTVASTQSTRILIVAISQKTVWYDSTDQFARGDVLAGDLQSYSFPAERRRGELTALPAIVGNFEEDGEEWLLVGLDSLNVRPGGYGEQYYIMFAQLRPTQSLQEALTDFGTELVPLFVQAAVVGLVIAVALAALMTRAITRPLQHVAASAADIADGNYAVRAPIQGVNEVQAVADAFNRMAEKVQDEQRSQQDFLANVSHDLKTPLTSIQGFSQAIMDGAAPDPVGAARIIYDEAARLNRMVVELTDLARLQAGRLSMHISALDMSQLTQAIVERLSIMAREKGVALVVEARPMPNIAGDGDRLAQVLTNLISNAIKFTPPGGTVTVRTQVRTNGVEVVVQDTGAGIAAEDLPRVFERFYQVDKARGPRRGTGLGLSIVQEIVQAHGGTITVSSPGVNSGSTFTIWLPSPEMSTILRRRV